MSIATRQPEADGVAALHIASLPRNGDEPTIDSPRAPDGPLLARTGLLAPAPAPAPARALALDALRLLRRMRRPTERPARWELARFAAEVDLVRAHLAPLRTRRALAASFGREAFHVEVTPLDRDDPAAVRVAYAVRWLELGDARPRAPFAALLADPTD